MGPGRPPPARSGAPTCTTAATSTSGWRRPAGIARGSTAHDWRPVETVPFDRSLIEPRVAPPVRVIATLPCDDHAAAGRTSLAARCGPERGGLGPDARPRVDRRHRHGPPCGGPRAGRLAAHAVASVGQGDRHLRARRQRPHRARTVVHLPRLPLRRDRGRHRAPRRLGRRHQLGRYAAQPVRRAPTRCSSASTRTSCGRFATTSCPSRPTVRSATSDSAGPAMPRPSPRPRRCSSTVRRSGRAGCATLRSSRTRSLVSRPSCRTSWSAASRGSDARAGRTRRRSSHGRSTRPTAIPRSCARNLPACAPTSTRSTLGAGRTACSRRPSSSAIGSTQTPHRIGRGWPRRTAATWPTPSWSTALG